VNDTCRVAPGRAQRAGRAGERNERALTGQAEAGDVAETRAAVVEHVDEVAAHRDAVGRRAARGNDRAKLETVAVDVEDGDLAASHVGDEEPPSVVRQHDRAL